VKVKTLKWLFRTYAETDIGLRSLCESLNTRGIPSPGADRRDSRGNRATDQKWQIGTVAAILRNEVYCGDFIWAKRRIGKYRRVAGTTVKKRELELTSRGNVATKRNVREEWIVVKDTHPALIDRATFERIQQKLTRRKSGTKFTKKNGGRYLLTGIVRCGHCGAKMYGTRGTRRKGGTTYVYERYICSTYHTKGKGECQHHAIDQALLTDFIIRRLREWLLDGQTKDELRAAVRKNLAVQAAPAKPGEVESLKKKLAECNQRVAKWTENVLDADPGVKDLLSERLAGLRKERDQLAAELATLDRASTKPAKATDRDAEVNAIVDRVWTLADDLQKADPARVRELFNRLVESVELWFGTVPRGNGAVHPLANGIVHLRPDRIFKVVNRGDRI
jgi:site-specific DNA recombinase